MSEKVELSRQQKKSRETKERIFQAAKRILQKKGYEELSIKNICEEAGVSNGSFYHHFRTKDECKRGNHSGVPQLCQILPGAGR